MLTAYEGDRMVLSTLAIKGTIANETPTGTFMIGRRVQDETMDSGTLGIDRDVTVGFDAIRLRLEVDAPEASAEQLAALHEKAERYCTVLQTLRTPPTIAVELAD